MITQEQLKESLSYNPDTGVFTWRMSRPRSHFKTEVGYNRFHSKQAGKVITSANLNGYPRILLFGKYRQSHRLAFLYMEGELPENHVDHINHIKTDNSWRNLRHATVTENSRNKTISKRNTSGCSGVVWNKRSGKWQAQIGVTGTLVYLGVFDSFFDACCSIYSARNKYGFHKNHAEQRKGEKS